MSPVVEQIKQVISPILERHGVTKAALFGSALRGQLQPNSDIDLLIELDADTSLLGFVELKLELQEALGRNVDLVEYSTIKPRLRDVILRQQEIIL